MVAQLQQLDVPYASTVARVEAIKAKLAALKQAPASLERDLMISTLQAHLQAAEQWLAGLMEYGR